MRILLLTQVAPFPPDSGPRIKTYNVLRYLAQRHDVHLVSFVRTEAERNAAESLRQYCVGVTTVPLQRSIRRDLGYFLRSLLTRRPFLIERDDSGAMREAIASLLAGQSFDAIHADQISMAQFAVDASVSIRVLDEHNAVWTIVRRAAERIGWGPRRVAAELEWRKLRAYEGSVCRRFEYTTVVSKEDQRFLEEAAGTSFSSLVAPIAIDCDELVEVRRSDETKHVLSVATMFYPPNADGVQWFAERIFPLIRRDVPGTGFLIVGARPPERIQRLGLNGTGITVTGYVADLDPILRQSAVLIVPVHSGSGMRVKILEAFARGIPVVSTAIGVEGIEATPGEHLLVADEPEDFARAVVTLLNDPREAARIAGAARKLVVNRYDYRAALRDLDRIYPVIRAPAAVST